MKKNWWIILIVIIVIAIISYVVYRKNKQKEYSTFQSKTIEVKKQLDHEL